MAERKNNVFLSMLHFSASGEADDAKRRFEEIILALMGLQDTWLVTVKGSYPICIFMQTSCSS